MAKKLDLGQPVGSNNSNGLKKKSVNTKKKEAGSQVDLNFKVNPEFKREFKLWATAHDMTQKRALELAFELLKDSHI